MEPEFLAAQAACNRQDYATAALLLQSHLKLRPNDGRGWELWGLVLHYQNDRRQSVAALEHASLLVPLMPAARVCLALNYGKIGRTNLSRELLQELLSDAELAPELLLEAAEGLDEAGAQQLAMQACRLAAQRDPYLARAYFSLGYYSAKCGRPIEVTVSLARRAISLDPEHVVYRIGLASLLMKLERDAEAYQVVKHLSDAQIESVGCACCLERVALLYESSQDYRRAILCRRRLLHLTAQSSTADREGAES